MNTTMQYYAAELGASAMLLAIQYYIQPGWVVQENGRSNATDRWMNLNLFDDDAGD